VYTRLDYSTFISTAKLLIEEYRLDAHFVIIGDGPLRSDVEQWIEKSGISSYITMTGFRSDVPEILPELDVFLITSETEGLGTSILDAFACEVPVVATAAGGIPVIVHHKETGLLAPIKDYDSLAELVHQLAKDKSLQKHLVEGASQLLQRFTKESVAEQTKASYEALLS
jgi:glycosyltransferase involved in cell wall biosynthesis